MTILQAIILQKDRFRMRTLNVEEERSGRSLRMMNRKILTKDPKMVKNSCDTTKTDVLVSSIVFTPPLLLIIKVTSTASRL